MTIKLVLLAIGTGNDVAGELAILAPVQTMLRNRWYAVSVSIF
jgi:hypothetical protein